jgi:hypothetical protein
VNKPTFQWIIPNLLSVYGNKYQSVFGVLSRLSRHYKQDQYYLMPVNTDMSLENSSIISGTTFRGEQMINSYTKRTVTPIMSMAPDDQQLPLEILREDYPGWTMNDGFVAFDNSLTWFHYEPQSMEVSFLFLANNNDVDMISDLIGQDVMVTREWLDAMKESAFYEKWHSGFEHNYMQKCVFGISDD